jgi:two-component system phosphate regulon sensor histidine kinase PhoR
MTQDQPMLQRELQLHRDGRRLHFQTSATRTAVRGVLLVLRDVTSLSQAVQMKTDFVANASHELRTPIAALKAAFETLDEARHDDPQQLDRCVTIMALHLKRLEEMLRDLLDLSRVEDAELKPQTTDVRLAEVLASVEAVLSPAARDKSITLSSRVAPVEIKLHSDERLLSLVLKNLVENSIKFTPAGGRVEMSATLEDTGVCLRVTDTGIGIAPEHVDRVFERFYQVDPARTGGSGRGTGLGLAIVKHAVAALRGTVQLKSQVNAGTSVSCLIPLDAAARTR